MVTSLTDIQQSLDAALTLRPEEHQRLEKRRKDVQNYDPPKWRSSQPDPVSGDHLERMMVPHASILPVWGSRKLWWW